ncbi:MAG: 2-oxoacid:acceptor oxidoreductase family protein [Pseudomonadota bacterium]
MQYEVIFAGFGGQGVLAIGQILAKAAMDSGKSVVWLPSYGPEMRGGTANCTVVISDREIASPIISTPTCAVVMNRPSFDKFSPGIKPDGLLLINSSLIDVRSDRKDIAQLLIPANDVAIKEGFAKSANMAMLGAFVGRSKVIEVAAVRKSLEEKLGSKKNLLVANLNVFDQGVVLGAADGGSGKR